ncbi:MAG: periplasmic heavy metal sensor [Bacteroidota bacterium]
MKRLISLLVALSLLGTLSLAIQDPPADRGPGRMLDRLVLTDQQKPEFERLQADHMKKMIDQIAKVATTGVDLRTLLREEAPQKAAIEKKMKEIADLRTQVQLARLEHWFAVQKILTPEQQKVWKSALEQPGSRHHMGRPAGMRQRTPRGPGCGMGPQGPPMDR